MTGKDKKDLPRGERSALGSQEEFIPDHTKEEEKAKDDIGHMGEKTQGPQSKKDSA